MGSTLKAGRNASTGEGGKKKKIGLIIGIVIFIAVAALLWVGYTYLQRTEEEKWSAQLEEANAKINANKRFVYVATTDIRAGETISDANVELQTASSSMDADLFAGEEDLGLRTKIAIAAGSQITKDVLLQKEFAAGDRAVEYQFIYCGMQINEGDFVDVRIVFPDGSDYTILTKKCVEGKGENDDTSVVLWLNEEEMQLMSSAVVDAFVYSYNEYSVKKSDKYVPSRNSRIYAVKYVEPNLQDASRTDYTPSEATINRIKSNPNIVEVASEYLSMQVRAEYEERLFNYMSEETMSILGYEEHDDVYKQWQDYINSGSTDEGTPVGNNANTNDEDDLLSGYDPSGN